MVAKRQPEEQSTPTIQRQSGRLQRQKQRTRQKGRLESVNFGDDRLRPKKR